MLSYLWLSTTGTLVSGYLCVTVSTLNSFFFIFFSTLLAMTFEHVYMHAQIHACTYTHTHKIHINTGTHTYAGMHVHTCTCARTHKHTHTQQSMVQWMISKKLCEIYVGITDLASTLRWVFVCLLYENAFISCFYSVNEFSCFYSVNELAFSLKINKLSSR